MDDASPKPQQIERRRYTRHAAPHGLQIELPPVSEWVQAERHEVSIDPVPLIQEGVKDRIDGQGREQSIGGGIDQLIAVLRENRAKLAALRIESLSVTAVKRHE
jgi:hypothetical protein